jgi:hypothetical protein
MFWRHIVTLVLILDSATVWAENIDLNLRGSSIQIQYGFPMSEENPEKSEFHVGALYNETQNLMGDFGFLINNTKAAPDSPPEEIPSGVFAPKFATSFGMKGVITNTKPRALSSVAFGVQLHFSPSSAPRFGILGQFYYAPSIVAFGGANRYVETGLRLEYEILPQTIAYLGYRRIEFGLKLLPAIIFDSGAQVGMKINF